MAFYIRVLSPSADTVPVSELAQGLDTASLNVETGSDAEWEQLVLSHADGREIAVVERNVVSNGSMAQEEIDDFVQEVGNYEPASAAQWLVEYLPRVKIIYVFQVLGGTKQGNGWAELGSIKSELWNRLGGIFQSDGEGFSNEDGYHILWQFSDGVSGLWWMGVLKNGSWTHFEMELGDCKQREQFLQGNVPVGSKLAE